MNSLLTRKETRHPAPADGRMREEVPQFNFQFRFNRNTSWMTRIGFLGMLGWAIIVPTLLGFSMGLWLDAMYPGGFSWTSFLLPAGLFLGCFAAGYWFRQDFASKDSQAKFNSKN